MAKEVSTRARYLAMILGGIIALFLIPRDPWPIGYFIYLYFCSIVGSSAGHLIVKENFKKFFIAVCITSFFFGLGIFIVDINDEGSAVFSDYLMWLPLMTENIILTALASTLTTFPLMGSLVELAKGR